MRKECTLEWVDDNGNVIPNNIIKLPNDVVKEHIDVIEVVLCKDCRHRDLFSCPLADNDFQKDEDFCSWGERGENDDY